MPSRKPQTPSNPLSPTQSIPLSDLASPVESPRTAYSAEGSERNGIPGNSSGSKPPYSQSNSSRDERSKDSILVTSPSSGIFPNVHNFLTSPQREERNYTPKTTTDHPTTMGFAGLVVPDIHISSTPRSEDFYDIEDFNLSPYSQTTEYSSSRNITQDSDKIPLNDPNSQQPISGAELLTLNRQYQDPSLSNFQNGEHENPRTNHRRRKLGDELVQTGSDFPPNSLSRSRSGKISRMRSKSPASAAEAISRASTIVRAMSQRVVNISGEAEIIEASARWEASKRDSIEDNVNAGACISFDEDPRSQLNLKHEDDVPVANVDTTAQNPNSPTEKETCVSSYAPPQQDYENQLEIPVNPLRGKTLGFFSPESWIRNKLCDLLVYPLAEPAILALIILQTLLLAYQSSQNVYKYSRESDTLESPIDYALFLIFIIFTLELTARIIVSGFVFNAPEYTTRTHKKSFRAEIRHRYQQTFRPQKNVQAKTKIPIPNEPIGYRSFASLQSESVRTVEQAQRLQLARRAFLRHSFNRMDFVAVCAFWVAFLLGLTGIENSFHLHIARMLSHLRILRLLAITNGTAVILRSLKKAAPLLVNVSFLIGFFWLLFAIIGVQSFKSSLDRQCVWVDPADPANLTGSAYINSFQFCGGQLNSTTGAHDPWVIGTLDNLSPGAEFSKGFLCPRGSYCLQLNSNQLPYNGTVSFDNIFQSLELVFVVMTANTFTDIMSYTMNSDYLTAAFFFAGIIVVMLLWLLNLLIAVITSSFQVIREESKASAFATQFKQILSSKEDSTPFKNNNSMKSWFDKTYWFWNFIIAFDMFCQALQTSDMSSSRANFIDSSQKLVTLVLLFEVFIRFLVDWRAFFSKNKNLIDLGLSLITTAIQIPIIRNSGRPYAWLTVFQILRIYRLILAVPVTKSLLALVLGNSSGIANLILFVFLITFLMSILAAQLFRGELPPEDASGETLKVSFFTLWNSFLGMYQVLSSEDWTSPLYDLTSFDDAHHSAWIAGVFLIMWFILGNFILVNMFIAVIQESFDVSEDEKRMHQVRAFLNRNELGSSSSNLSMSAIVRLGRSRSKKDPLDHAPASVEMLLKDAVVQDFLDNESKETHEKFKPSEISVDLTADKQSKQNTSSFLERFLSRFLTREPNPFYSHIQLPCGVNESTDATTMAKEAVSATMQRKKAQREYLAKYPNYNTTLYLFKPNNPVRRLCQKMVGPGRGKERFDGIEPHRALWYTFSAIIYGAIVIMVLIACVTTPLHQKEYLATHDRNWFMLSDLAFAILFTVEALIKVVADGFFWTPNAYFRSSWGLIDGIVLVTFWINVITSISNDGAVSRAVGAFKAFRALRLLNVSDSARNTFHSLIIVGGWKIVSAALVSLSLLFPFAIYGLNLFRGQMLSCNDSDPSNIYFLTDCFGEFNNTPFSSEWPILAPRVVSNSFFDFDNFGSSLFVLFQIVSQEGWVDVMWAAQSITGLGLQPQPFSSQENAVFFILFNLLATVFVLTLFISVFMRNYTEQTGVAFLTADQRSWLELRKLLRQVSPSKRPFTSSSNKIKSWCFKSAVQKRGKWQRLVTTVLVLHLLLLLAEFYSQPLWWEYTRAQIFFAFTLFFMTNIMIRIVGLSWARFRRSYWDIYSLFVVFGSFGSITLHLVDMQSQAIIRIHKLFLVMTVLLLIPRNDALDQLFKTAAASVANIGNLLATWFVLFIVYAIALTQTFGLTRFGENEDNNQNFRTVPKALILLFRMSCGEGWNAIMEDYATILPPLCVSDSSFYNSDCGSPQWARALFISWNILSMYIFTSLFVSLIYESFSYVYQNSNELRKVSREDIRRFKEAWALFDPNGTGFIPKQKFPRLLKELSGVFSMKIYPSEHSVQQILKDVRKSSVRGTSNLSGSTAIDVKILNARIAQIDATVVRGARSRYNHFFEEVMVSANIDRGIAFSKVLMILAYYNVINYNKSLKLEEFLRRRARLQRIEEQVRRRTVLGYFETMYWSRRFRQHCERKQRKMSMTQQGLPKIFNEKDNTKHMRINISPVLSPLIIPPTQSSMNSSHSDLSMDNAVRQRSGSTITSTVQPTGLSPQLSHNRAISTAFALESGNLGGNDQGGSKNSSRRGSNVSAEENVLEVLDNSAWGESIRRSFTMKQASRGHDGFGHTLD
ncbi:Calcium-channel protein [Podosphaera aphanis]|nr:Calcium-channel protein [Podosphaera aphanis]